MADPPDAAGNLHHALGPVIQASDQGTCRILSFDLCHLKALSVDVAH